jgi:hypothetical protein
MGIILVGKLSSGREASDTVRSQEGQGSGAGRIYTTSSWLKGHDSFPTSAVLGILHSLQVYLLLSSFFYDTRDRGCADVVWGRLRCPGPFPFQHPIVGETMTRQGSVIFILLMLQ